MSAPIKNVLFIGASGQLGEPCLRAFVSTPNSPFHVSVLSRKESTATFPPSVNVIKSDYTPASLEESFKGQDAVISLLGTAGLPQQKAIVDAAIKAGVKRFVPSEFGSRTHDERVRAIVPLYNGKRELVEYLIGKEGQISWTGVVSGPFFDWGLKVGFLGPNIKDHTVTLLDGGNVPFSTTNLRTIGRALFSLLSKPSVYQESANKYVTIASHTLTQNDIVAVLEKITGETWKKIPASGKELAQEGLEKSKKGDFSGIVGLISAAAWGRVHEVDLGDARPDGLWNDKLGLPKEDLEEDIRAVLDGKAP